MSRNNQTLTIYLRSGNVVTLPILPGNTVKWKNAGGRLTQLLADGIGPGYNGLWFDVDQVEAFTVTER